MSNYQQHFIDQAPVHLQPVLRAAMDRFQLGEMSIHGPVHWLKVFQFATTLAKQTPNADLDVCQLFALLHDCERRNEGTDPQHGPRAADYAMQLHKQGLLPMSDEQMLLLCEACTYHASGRTSGDPTLGVCWDADRLDLPRVGMTIDKKYLSTMAAKRMLASG